MSEPSTADIIAALHGDQAALARVRGGRGSWSRTAEGIVAADRLAELDALRPPCPTCGGTGRTVSFDEAESDDCPDCVDGKVSIEQLVATYNAVWSDEPMTIAPYSRGLADIIEATLRRLRSVKP